MDNPDAVIVDPTISRKKFTRELATYASIAEDRRKSGWWILDATFPRVLVAFATPKLRPACVPFGASIDFTNYDYWPPSVRIVNPFSGDPYKYRDLKPSLQFRRKLKGQMVDIPGMGPMQAESEQPLLVAHDPDEIPFLCLPGVREYHFHPAHSGDSWLLHRARGEGTLYFILEKLYRYGIEPLKGFQYGFQVVDYLRPESPE